VNIIIVFSSILLAADHVTRGINIQNKSGSQAKFWNLLSDILFQIRMIIHPVIKNVIKE